MNASTTRLAFYTVLVGGTLMCATVPALAANATSESGRTTGVVIDDTVITAKVKAALVRDDQIKAFDINVDTRNGYVVLRGAVDNKTQIDRAITLAQSVADVKSVSSQLTVKK